MKSKNGQLGFSVTMLYRVFLIILISLFVLGASSMIYSYSINTRDSEAMLLIREISDCVITGGVVNLNEMKSQKDLFEYCGFNSAQMEKYYASVDVLVNNQSIFIIRGGDSGLLFVRDIFSTQSGTEKIDKYEPGHFNKEYSVSILENGIKKDGIIKLEVVVNA